MSGEHDPFDDPSLKGMSRYFNSTTTRGRANVNLKNLINTSNINSSIFLRSQLPRSPSCSCTSFTGKLRRNSKLRATSINCTRRLIPKKLHHFCAHLRPDFCLCLPHELKARKNQLLLLFVLDSEIHHFTVPVREAEIRKNLRITARKIVRNGWWRRFSGCQQTYGAQ